MLKLISLGTTKATQIFILRGSQAIRKKCKPLIKITLLVSLKALEISLTLVSVRQTSRLIWEISIRSNTTLVITLLVTIFLIRWKIIISRLTTSPSTNKVFKLKKCTAAPTPKETLPYRSNQYRTVSRIRPPRETTSILNKHKDSLLWELKTKILQSTVATRSSTRIRICKQLNPHHFQELIQLLELDSSKMRD